MAAGVAVASPVMLTALLPVASANPIERLPVLSATVIGTLAPTLVMVRALPP